jgi:predicted nucleotidyltransferase
VSGSVLHGEDTACSDLELLVNTLAGMTLFDQGDLRLEREELPGIRVDLLTLGDLPLKFRDQVLAEARHV